MENLALPYFAVILLGAATILAFDTIGSLASRKFAFAYSGLMPGSFAIYFAVGFAAASGGLLIPSVCAGGSLIG